jgi:DNA-binding MarR family transcriptional regulator
LQRQASTRLGALARELGVSDATASEAVSALVAKGLVRRARAAEDARALALALTAAGRREARRAAQWPDAFLLGVAELTAEERGVLLRGLTKIIRRLQLEGRIPLARMCATCRFFRPHAHRDAQQPHHCDFVDAAFGERELRLECADHAPAADDVAQTNWQRFVAGRS